MREHLLIRRYVFIFCCLWMGTIKAQNYVAIPDTNFVKWLKSNGYSSCFNINVPNELDTTCSNVVNANSINCSSQKIADLTGIQYFDKLTDLSCYTNNLDSLPPLPPLLTGLSCHTNKLTSLPTLPAGLKTLECSLNQITALPDLPNTLLTLSFGDNFVTVIPPLPATLTRLSAGRNLITELPNLPPALNNMVVSNNRLTALPTLPASLVTIWCQYNLLTELPVLPASLNTLFCDSNMITILPALPPKTLMVVCSRNPLTTIVSFNDTLQSFSCDITPLTALPKLPRYLQSLYCSYTPLTHLPELNPELRTLYCYNDSLVDSLVAIPGKMDYIDCHNNKLTYLPALPNSLTKLNCSNNRLTKIEALPNKIWMLVLSNNPDLYCLPPLQRFDGNVADWNLSFTGITCLPNRIQHGGLFVGLDNMPLCDLVNPYNCEIGWNIEGNVYLMDEDTCPTNIDGKKVGMVKMNLYEGSNLIQSEYFPSNYTFKTGYGTYRVEVDKDLPLTSPCKMDSVVTVSSGDSLHYNVDFGLVCKTCFDVGTLSIIPERLRPSLNSMVRITAGDMSTVYGAHCASGVSGTVTVKMSGAATYVGPAPGARTPSNVNGNTIQWSVEDFGTAVPTTDFNIIVHTDDNADLNSSICFTVTVSPKEGDCNPKNNTLKQCVAIRNSHDPNEKEVSPLVTIDTSEKWLTYTIHFQNTGNDTAYQVRIADTLDDNLDHTTFQLLAYSNKVIVQQGYKIVQFNFPYINLPDSMTNEAKSHGFVQYRIKIRENLAKGVQIKNSASIYFDNNDPILTNSTINTVTYDVATFVPTLANEAGMVIFPNPATTRLNIATYGFQPAWVSITDVSGKKLMEQKFTPLLDISTLYAGVYFIEVKGTDGTIVKRLVKM